jgi:predicted ATPase
MVWNLWLLGYMDRALQRGYETLTLAQELSHPFRLAFALIYIVRVHQLRREVQTTREQAEALMGLGTEQGFTTATELGRFWKGWALAEEGQEEGIGRMQQGIAGFRATGTLILSSFLGLLAESCGKGGRTEEGLAAVAEALALVDETGERFWEAELYRLKGTLTLQSKVQGPKSYVEKEAEECFHTAIEIARRQSAKSLELRAVMSLARLWQQQGNKAEAHQLLSEIYDWFTEGFATKDLQEAKALLDELRQ